jgi:hypothetical protein
VDTKWRRPIDLEGGYIKGVCPAISIAWLYLRTFFICHPASTTAATIFWRCGDTPLIGTRIIPMEETTHPSAGHCVRVVGWADIPRDCPRALGDNNVRENGVLCLSFPRCCLTRSCRRRWYSKLGPCLRDSSSGISA